MGPRHQRFRDYLTVKQAAEFLGVCADTLRNWDRAGKLSAVRHPVNGYRLYRTEQLEALLRLPAVRASGLVAAGRQTKRTPREEAR